MSDFDWLDNPSVNAVDNQSEYVTDKTLSRPRLSYKRTAKREIINGLKKQALNELIPELPPPDTDLYIIGNGSGAEVRHGINPLAFDFGSFIPHLAGHLGKQAILYVSTWTMNAYHAKAIVELLDTGALSQVTVFTDPYFKAREAAVCNQLIIGLQKHSTAARFLAFKNHVKAICMTNATQSQFVTITGSANLSAQPRCERYVLTTASEIYRFFVDEFFEAMLNGEKEKHKPGK